MPAFSWRMLARVNPNGFSYHLLAVRRSVRLPGHSGQNYRLTQQYDINPLFYSAEEGISAIASCHTSFDVETL